MSANNQDFLNRRAGALLSAAVLAMLIAGPLCWAEDAQPTTFERVFGVPGTFDAAMVAKVKALPAGERLAVDRDGDGKHDELWFIDDSLRHTAERRPILVRVIDEDGDTTSVALLSFSGSHLQTKISAPSSASKMKCSDLTTLPPAAFRQTCQ